MKSAVKRIKAFWECNELLLSRNTGSSISEIGDYIRQKFVIYLRLRNKRMRKRIFIVYYFIRQMEVFSSNSLARVCSQVYHLLFCLLVGICNLLLQQIGFDHFKMKIITTRSFIVFQR